MALFKNLKQVSIGTVTGTASMPVTMTKIGIVTDAGVSFNESDPDKENLREAGNNVPVGQNLTPGELSFTFQLMLDSADVLANVRGGTNTSGKWTPDATFAIPETAIRLETPDADMNIEALRCSIWGKFAGQMGDKGQVLLDVTATPLDPQVNGAVPYWVNFNAQV